MSKSKSKPNLVLIALFAALGLGAVAQTVTSTVALTSIFDGNTVFQNVPYIMSQDEVCSILKVRLHGQPEGSFFYKIFTEDYNRTCSRPWVDSTETTATVHGSAPCDAPKANAESPANTAERPLNHL